MLDCVNQRQYTTDMTPNKQDVEEMVVALFSLIGGLERATRHSGEASTLEVLQAIAPRGQLRPSEIAALRGVHPSLVTRQIRSLEDAGYVEISPDSADHRSCLVRLTPSGEAEMLRLQRVGLDRFATFVADWEPAEMRSLTALLRKLERSKADAATQTRRPAGHRWAVREPTRTD
jgi:DNA-binding MarR family transcriptional regulator